MNVIQLNDTRQHRETAGDDNEVTFYHQLLPLFLVVKANGSVYKISNLEVNKVFICFTSKLNQSKE